MRMSDCCLQGIEPCECKGEGHRWIDNQVLDDYDCQKREKRSEISGRDLQKPFREFKTVNSILMTKR